MDFCKNCGDPIPEGARFCVRCGAATDGGPWKPLEEESERKKVNAGKDQAKTDDGMISSPKTVKTEDKKGGFPKIIVPITTILVIGGLFLGLSGRSSSEKSSDKMDETNITVAETRTASEVFAQMAEEEKEETVAEDAEEPALGVALLNYVDVTNYPVVSLYYQIVDEFDNPIVLNAPETEIMESVAGEMFTERTCESVERLMDSKGLSIDLVVDKSEAISENLGLMQDVMRTFVKYLDYSNGDQVELIAYEDTPVYMCSYTSDIDLLVNGINSISPYGSSAFYDAAMEGIRNASEQNGAKCVILFTSGYDDSSYHTFEELRYAAELSGIRIHVVGTDNARKDILEELADITGGTYWDVSEITDLRQILNSIYEEQKNIYCIRYRSDENADPYAQREVDLEIHDLHAEVVGTNTFTPAPVVEHEEHANRYELIREDISWTDANEACLQRGGHLISITSQEEMDMASAMAEQAGLKYVWLGGYTMINGGIPYGHWITGEDFEQYTAWYPGEPSRNDVDGTVEKYLMLWRVKDDWSWNDQRDDPAHAPKLEYFKGKTGYICEYEQ